MKNDPILGLRVNKHLEEMGIETPTRFDVIDKLSDKEIKEQMENAFSVIMQLLGLDLEDDSLRDTPRRVSKMYIDEIFQGLKYDNFPKCTTVDNKMKYDEMVLVNNISVQSNCEHHFVIIDGKASVAYIPGDKVLGLSKINRIVEFFSKRPQIQERLTEQIFHALQFILETKDVAVIIKATHYCVKSRGVRDENSDTTTSKLGGIFKEAEARAEFLNLSR